jgi:DNA-binding transcriptional MerR regulator
LPAAVVDFGGGGMADPGPGDGVYGISVVATLSGVNIRSVRLYERHGLLRPARTPGGTRLFSQDDVRQLRRIAELVADGVNLAGVARILGLEAAATELRVENGRLRGGDAAAPDAPAPPPVDDRPPPRATPAGRRRASGGDRRGSPRRGTPDPGGR